MEPAPMTAHRLRRVAHLQALLIVALLAGAVLAFGGAVWWARPVGALLLLALVAATLAHAWGTGGLVLLKSPLSLLGLLAIGLAVAQLAPLPAPLAARLSPSAHAAHALGVLPQLAAKDDPGAALGPPAAARTPATLDRAATLRWTAGALGCLALFWSVAHFADRLQHTQLVWGAIVAAFFVVTGFGLIQQFGRTEGLYGRYVPGAGPAYAPSLADVLGGPTRTLLRPAGDPAADTPWSVALPEAVDPVAGLPGGAGAYLALAALALPLALGLTLQLMAPRGSRESLALRLRHTRRGGGVVSLFGLTVLSAGLAGYLGGAVAAVPIAIGLAVAGLPAARGSGLGAAAVAPTLLVLLSLAGGAGAASAVGPGPAAILADRPDAPQVRRDGWRVVAAIAGDFPLVGVGLGAFPVVEPYYKAADASATTASALGQWWAESGLVGMGLLALAAGWCAWRMPGAVRRVGSADRTLPFTLVGAGLAFAMLSAMQWSVQVGAIAMAASAVAGTAQRWLAGGTDLFVERS
jgi:hypothetical protein